jgi:hypothetical protein
MVERNCEFNKLIGLSNFFVTKTQMSRNAEVIFSVLVALIDSLMGPRLNRKFRNLPLQKVKVYPVKTRN